MMAALKQQAVPWWWSFGTPGLSLYIDIVAASVKHSVCSMGREFLKKKSLILFVLFSFVEIHFHGWFSCRWFVLVSVS